MRRRDEVDVRDRSETRVARLQAAAVDQHQGALRAEAAQVDRRRYPSRRSRRSNPCAANDCGSELIRSSVRVVPWSLMSWLVSTVTGLADVRFGCGMRVPVMTMSLRGLTGAPCALVDGVVVPSTGAVVWPARRRLRGAGACRRASAGRRRLRLRKSRRSDHAGANQERGREQALTEIELHRNLPLH